MKRIAILVLALVAAANAHAANVAGPAFAWSENAGWINFAPTSGPGVTVDDAAVSGMAWSENLGWITLFPIAGGVMNDGAGHLSGYAWGENAGWINFAGVSIDANGRFAGYAWGENVGWINFATQAQVVTTWRAVDALFRDGFE